ncbi:MAG: zinc-ribbon domain-containing protein [Acidobacteriia bacterium]|nr:zinc-ribbon domain-containing protein [Terriglobia bacterium]
MAVCAKCGAALAEGVGFCGSCGTPVAAGGPGPTAPPAAWAAAPAGGGLTSNVAGLLAYLFWPITCVLFLVVEPYNKDKFVRFHSFQARFLGIAAFGVAIVLGVITIVLMLIPWVGAALAALLWAVFVLAVLGLVIFVMYNAYNNELYMIPFIGQLAAKQAG